MTFEEKMKVLKDVIFEVCYENGDCSTCRFTTFEDARDDGYYCSIRDREGKIPWCNGWKVEEALGIQEPYKPVFSEAVEESIMRHFERVE